MIFDCNEMTIFFICEIKQSAQIEWNAFYNNQPQLCHEIRDLHKRRRGLDNKWNAFVIKKVLPHGYPNSSLTLIEYHSFSIFTDRTFADKEETSICKCPKSIHQCSYCNAVLSAWYHGCHCSQGCPHHNHFTVDRDDKTRFLSKSPQIFSNSRIVPLDFQFYPNLESGTVGSV